MDTLKLLTKGTNLRKSLTTTDTQVLPSTGPAQPKETVDEVITRGKKRKRPISNETSQTLTKNDSALPDFFDSRPADEKLEIRTKSIKKKDVTREQIDDAEITFKPRTADECKQILHKHKLKVTLMIPPRQKSKRTKNKTPTLMPIAPQPLETFGELRARFKISRRLAENLSQQGYSTPTEVQLGTIPILLGNDTDRGLPGTEKNKNGDKSHVDLLTISPTGSGKTLAFLIPLIQGLLDLKHQDIGPADNRSHTKAIILAPTHELTDQIVNEARKLSQGTGLRAVGMQKGMSVLLSEEGPESEGVAKAEILVSTPLALANALATRPIPSVQYLILDEADVLLDPLFREQTLSVWKSLNHPSLSVSLWSATIGSSIEHLAQEMIASRRVELSLPRKGHHIVRVIAGLKDSSLPTISHRLVYCANEAGKLLAVRQILHPATADPSTPSIRPPFLIFTQTIPRASALHSELLYDISIEAGGSSRIAVLHSSLSPTARSEIMTRFRTGEIWILITTDLLSRGVDFRGINGIVNYDIPTTSAAYIHRSGRTGRAGREGGIAVTLYTKEDIPYIKNVANVIAASEKVHGKNTTDKGDSALPDWLLAALPDVSKKSKQLLKKRGVEERRAGNDGKGASRISTKSGFQRQLENKKKGAVQGSKRRRDGDDDSAASASDAEDEVWGGLED